VNQDDFNPVNKIGRFLAPSGNEGDFELGGYVPLAFSRTISSSLARSTQRGTSIMLSRCLERVSFSATNGVVERKDTIWDYSGKLTWQLNSKPPD